MQVNHTPSFMLRLESRGEGWDLVNTATIMPDCTHTTSRRVVVGVNSGASEAPRAFLKLGLNAQKLRRAATQLLQKGNMSLPVGKNLPVGLE